MTKRLDALRRAGPSYDPATPPPGTKLWLGIVASRLGVTITEMAAACTAAGCQISRTGIADVLSNRWPVKTPQEGIRTALSELLEQRGATDDELAQLYHAHGRGSAASNGPSGPDQRAREPVRPPPSAPTPPPEEPDMLPLKAILTPQAKRHFKLFQNPFDGAVSSDEQMFRGAEFDYVIEAAWQAAVTSGFVAIVGESGAGKTTALEAVKARLEGEQQRVIIFEPSVLGMEENDVKGKTLKSADVLHAIIAALAPDQPVPQTVQARTLRAKKLLAASAGMGNSHLLVVEEAHTMPSATMKHLKRLHELREGRRNLLGILLLAQPELKNRLMSGMLDGSLREVAQRCEVVELLPLDGDIKPYLQTRAAAAGVELARLINDDGIEQLRTRLTTKIGAKTISLAYPLAVNNLLVRALNQAAALGAPVVTRDLVASA